MMKIPLVLKHPRAVEFRTMNSKILVAAFAGDEALVQAIRANFHNDSPVFETFREARASVGEPVLGPGETRKSMEYTPEQWAVITQKHEQCVRFETEQRGQLLRLETDELKKRAEKETEEHKKRVNVDTDAKIKIMEVQHKHDMEKLRETSKLEDEKKSRKRKEREPPTLRLLAPEVRFASALAKYQDVVEFGGNMLWNMFQGWKHSLPANEQAFHSNQRGMARMLLEIEGVVKHRVAQGVVYRLHPSIMRAYLERIGCFDIHAVLSH
jgi:hypothetical protein